MSKIYNLIKILNEARDKYYNQNNPTLSDRDYDKLYDELQQLEKDTNIIYSNSPTQSVGYEVKSKLNKVEHNIPLLSLDKTKSIDELITFLNGKECFLMYKYDGLTVELIYNKGKLIQGSTRGDGFEGEDITHNIKTFKNIPMTIPYKSYLKISGEAIIHKNDFNEINKNLTEEEKKKLPSGKYKTPRNLVAGSVRQLNNKICEKRQVYFYPFSILECEKEFNYKSEQLDWLKSLGFIRSNISLIDSRITNPRLLQIFINGMRDTAMSNFLPIDGTVLMYDDIKYSKTLGKTSHHPLHSLSFKFEDAIEKTILKDIEWSIGKTGQLTPVAIFDTVVLDGTDVSRASIHNLSILKELELGIGDEISIYKANCIIPQIKENFTKSNNIKIPNQCPICGDSTIIKKDNETEVLMCTNNDCSGILLKKFSHFVSKSAMNIDGLSESTLQKFINQGWLKTFEDIYNLQEYKNEIINLEGFGERSYNKLIQAIEKSKKIKMNKFLYALGISNIGKTASKEIAEYFNYDWIAFVKAVLEKFDFTQLKDFGSVMHFSIYEWYDNFDCRKMWRILATVVEFIKPEKKIINTLNNQFVGKKVYCTGSFKNYKKQELKDLLEGLGAIFTSGYAKSLDMLIEGSLKSSSKITKAKVDGVRIVSEDEFIKMINN